MKEHIINLDKPRKLRYGFKALKKLKEKYGDKKDLTDILNVTLDEIPYFAWAGLTWEDEALTLEKVEELIDSTIPDRYTIMDVLTIVIGAIAEQMGVKLKKKAKTGKKLKTPLRTTVKLHSK